MLDLVLWGILTGAAFLSAGHALLHKRDPRAALGWIMVCIALPGFGMILYWLMGVNRIRTRARDWQAQGQGIPWIAPAFCEWSADLVETLPFRSKNFVSLLNLSDRVTRRPLLPGNRITTLHNGEEAYPAMLAAIGQARERVFLSTYIFDSNRTGRQFVEALAAAAARGVEVCVLVDALGERYSFPPARRLLRKKKVKVARFLPPSLFGRGIYFNLRNHRKLLVVDGSVGFTGGMNIGDRHLAADVDNPRRVVDIHFRIEGPTVGHLEEAFLEDWQFATGESIVSSRLLEAAYQGESFCRGISAGPNEDFEKLRWLILGAINCARRTLRIMTPYFIPERPILYALNTAALRGVDVEIILPEKNNLPYVAWATRAYLWELLCYGIRIHYQPAPFAHSKLLVMDDLYVLIGSANLDTRSLRLNFEFDLEVYDRQLAGQLTEHFLSVRSRSREITLEEVDGRPLPEKLRDGLFKLFSPYL